jgi:DNA-binding XRE family transcriptional regulator
MSANKWTQEQRLKHSAKMAAKWKAKIGPNAHPLARARAKRDLTQRELADLAGVHISAVSELERSRPAGPGPRTRARLAAALAISEQELFA